MKKDTQKEEVDNCCYSKIRERAALLAESLNTIKERGIEILPHEPIEGKMFWVENE